MSPCWTFIKVSFRHRVLYLYREPSAIYAVFGASRSITLAPVKLHLLCLETPRQSSTSYKVVILQENGNWRQSRQKMEEKGKNEREIYKSISFHTDYSHKKIHRHKASGGKAQNIVVSDRPWTFILVSSQSHIIYNSSQRADETEKCFTVQSLSQSGGFLRFPFSLLDCSGGMFIFK